MDRNSKDVKTSWETYYRKSNAVFWIHSDSPVLGRPGDAQYSLQSINITDTDLEVRFDCGHLERVGSISAGLLRDQAGSIHLVLKGVNSLSGQLNADTALEVLSCSGEVRLVGMSPDIENPHAVDDSDYQALFSNSPIIL